MTSFLHALGRRCARHRLTVLAAWLVVLVAVVVAARSADVQTDNDLTLAGTDSQQATDLLRAHFPKQANGTVPVLFVAPAGAAATAGARGDAIDRAATAMRGDPLVTGVTSPVDPGAQGQVSKDGRIARMDLTLGGAPGALTDAEAERLRGEAATAASSGLDVSIAGYVGQKLSRPSSRTSEVVGLAAALVVLLITFGTVVAMGLPIVTAVVGLLIGISGITLLSRVSEVPTTAPALATMIGLGVGIDYGLFVVTRCRDLRAAGHDDTEAVARATATSGGAVVFAGGTVIIALLSLAVAGVPLVTQLGYVSALVVAIAVLAATTLLPALLGLVGPRIDALALPGRRPPAASPASDAEHAGGWARWARGVAARPLAAIVLALVVLGVLTAPIAGLHLGQTDDGALPRGTETRSSTDALTAGFGPGADGPMLIAASLGAPASSAADPRITALHDALAATPGVAAAGTPALSADHSAALVSVTATTAPSARATEDLVARLRDDVIPKATAGTDVAAHVGGTTARYIDLAAKISSELPLVVAVVLALSYVLLVLAFRSLLVPLKAVVMNLLSIGASFGAVTYAFGHDWTAQAVGLDGAVPIVSFVPLMMFAILFGLSMDYEVFLMSHVREEFQRHGDSHRAVVGGLAGTARVITSAALIMVSVFCAFLLSGDPNIKQFGLGMAIAVAIDATVVRCLLVPAVMVLLGRRAWWMPAWLERRTPRISIEGEEFFAARDRAPEPPLTPART